MFLLESPNRGTVSFKTIPKNPEPSHKASIWHKLMWFNMQNHIFSISCILDRATESSATRLKCRPDKWQHGRDIKKNRLYKAKMPSSLTIVLEKLIPDALKRPEGGRVVRRCWVNFQCRGVLQIRIIVGQGPIALAVGAGGVVWIFFLSSILSLLSPSLWETDRYRLKYCLKGPLNPKQPTNQLQRPDGRVKIDGRTVTNMWFCR